MGAVYAATDVTLGTRVAVKLMLNPGLPSDHSLVVRFEREVRAASGLDTEHVVRVLDFGRDPMLGAPFMVLEFLVGSDVQKAVETHGALPPATALRIVGQAALGLAEAHARGIIHRDIKAANLYLHEIGTNGLLVKVLDFGIAKVLFDDAAKAGPGHLTHTGALLGSPRYMSPEQAQALKTTDHRTDIWSLGVVLYQALCGRTPFAGADPVRLILAICSESPEPVERLAPWILPDAAGVVARCMRHDPDERYPSMRALAAAIAEVLGGPHFALERAGLRRLHEDERRPR